MGGEIPEVFKLLLERWRTLHPGWECKVWGYDEVHALISGMDTKLAGRFEQPGIAFSTKSDLARYHIIQKHGGIYLDTDFVALRPLDPLRQNRSFGVFETPERVCAGVFGSAPGAPFLDEVFEELRQQADWSKSPHNLAGPNFFSPIIRKHIEFDPECALLPFTAFLPVPYGCDNYAAADLRQSYAVHIWAHSWNKSGGSSCDDLFLRVRAVLVNASSK